MHALCSNRSDTFFNMKMSLLMKVTPNAFCHFNNNHAQLISNVLNLKLCKKKLTKVLASSVNVCGLHLCQTESFSSLQQKNENVTYDSLFGRRRLQAQHSVLIEVQSEKSCADVHSYCSQYGKINSMFHYIIDKSQRHFTLIEYESKNSIEAVLAASTYVNCDQIIPVQTTMLWFRQNKQKLDKILLNSYTEFSVQKYSTKILSDNEIFKSLLMTDTVSNQIMLLYNATKLTDVGVRLRFYTAHLMERCFYGLFPNIAVLPFGSTVNGFGKQGCDLDLSIILAKNKVENLTSRLIFQTKSNSPYEKYEIRKLIEVVADTMKVFLPGISNVRKILEARVPIIKFDHTLTGIQCDLSMTNMSAYYMSELLYTYGQIDNRVKPLIFTVRKWGESLQLTNKIVPGPCITNFSLSLMVIFFLQQKKIVPTLNFLKSHATQEDIRIADRCVDCTFQRDINKLATFTESRSTETLEELLQDFFTYYGNFDFETKAISLKDGYTISKPEYAALYICNPLECTLNVSKNVNFQELGRLRAAMRSAAWHLEDANCTTKSENWGLINLFLNKSIDQVHSTPSIDIEALFERNIHSASKKKLNTTTNQKKNK